MTQLLERLEARTRRAASRLDAAWAALASRSVVATPTMSAAIVAEPGFVAVPTATDVHARRPQEPSP
jgi:hypothetical protein